MRAIDQNGNFAQKEQLADLGGLGSECSPKAPEMEAVVPSSWFLRCSGSLGRWNKWILEWTFKAMLVS